MSKPVEITHRHIFNKLKLELTGTNIKVTTDENKYPTINNNIQYTTIIIKSYNRADIKDKTIEVLELIRGLNIKDYYDPSKSSFPGIEIENYKKVGKKEKSIIILFKYPDGKGNKIYDIWNEQLDNVFKTKRSLKRFPSDRNEISVIKTINSKLQEFGKGMPVTLEISHKRYYNVAGIVAGIGNKKSDFVIIDDKGEEIGFISHKSGFTATSFQQYSGTTKISGTEISNHKEVIEFNKIIVQEWEELSPSASRHINDNHLKKCAVFGKDYKSKSGYDSVDFLVQGDPKLTFYNGIVYLSFTTKVVEKGNLNKLSGDYDPVLGARTAEQYRKVQTFDRSLYGVRSGIWTKAYMENRKGNKQI